MRILPAIVCAIALSLTTADARASEPAPVSWLLPFFARHATPPPACKTTHACTAEEQASRDEVAEVRLSTARAITEVAYDPAEPPLYRKGKIGRAKTAALLASIAAHETGLQPRLVRGECAPGECDGGKAVGLMQIHPGPYGIRLTAGGAALCSARDAAAKAGDCLGRADLLGDPALTIRVALHILRGLGLSAYTGEGPCEGDASESRRQWANAWVESHPPPEDADVLQAMQEDADLR